jgi:hypothetical protein
MFDDREHRVLHAPIRQYFRDTTNVRVVDNGDGTVGLLAYNVGSGTGGGSGLVWDLDGGDPSGSNTTWDMEGGDP